MSSHHGFIKVGMNVDFFEYCSLASRFEKAGNILEALTIYQALSEVVAENMGNIDNLRSSSSMIFLLIVLDKQYLQVLKLKAKIGSELL